MQPSDAQMPAIVTRGRDVLVTAGAGSGKTRTLVARFLARLSEGTPLRSIVAITFTNKAALEMRNRVRSEIRRYLDRDDLLQPERDVWAAHAVALDAARIGTIHSLCQEILRAHPAEAGLDPDFGVLDEAHASLAQSQVIDEVLAYAMADASMAKLFETHGENFLRELLTRMLRGRLEAREALRVSPDVARRAVIARIMQMSASQELRDGVAALQDARDTGVLAAAKSVGDEGVPIVESVLTAWDVFERAHAVGAWADALDAVTVLLNSINLSKGRRENWKGHDPKSALKKIRLAFDADQAFLDKQPSMHIDAMHAVEYGAFVALFEQAERMYTVVRRTAGVLDFDDLESCACDLLRTRADVRARWRSELVEIMVDEFQDTNARQRELVTLLNGEDESAAGRLFVVGDPKQSIYRFRGADVRIFEQEKLRISNSGDCVDLSTSYRAHARLVYAMNDLLAPILGVQFAPLHPHRAQADAGFEGAPIELHLVLGSRDGALTQCARAVAARVREVVESASLRWDDVAVLCRAGRSFAAYENAFEQAGIPFLTSAGRGFYDRPEVRDALTQLQAIADPADELALAGLLRSPAFGVSDAGLYRMRWDGMTKRSLAAALACAEDIFAVDEPDRAATLRARAIIARLRAVAGRISAGALLKRLFDATHFPAILIRSGSQRAARNLEKLVADAHESGIISIAEFVEYVAHLRMNEVREGEARSTAEGAVQLMTVHAAKGLEWPVVVLGDLGYPPPQRADVRFDAQFGLLIPKRRGIEGQSAAYWHAYEQEMSRAEAESARLFYVAVTRAKELLILSGTAKKSAKNSARLVSSFGWLSDLIECGVLDLSHLPIAQYDETGVQSYVEMTRCGSSEMCCTLHELGRWAASPRTHEFVAHAVVDDGEPSEMLGAIVHGKSVEA
ncbi:MAG: UvrD-helicase domain-containing protein [Chloroflexi bacterium]|nr:UvrD-helicase domain-containing protein [Chloroflexota bacterium]